jgi:hypothetical protein
VQKTHCDNGNYNAISAKEAFAAESQNTIYTLKSLSCHTTLVSHSFFTRLSHSQVVTFFPLALAIQRFQGQHPTSPKWETRKKQARVIFNSSGLSFLLKRSHSNSNHIKLANMKQA